MPVSRRTLLLAAGAATLLGADRRRVDWAALDAAIDGSVERPGTTGYDTARRLYDQLADYDGFILYRMPL